MRALLFASAAAIAFGCAGASLYDRYYFDNLGGAPVSDLPELVTPTGPTRVYRGEDLQQDNLKMRQNGFVQIGYSAYNAGDDTPAHTLRQVQEFGARKQAAVALLYTRLTGTVTEQIPYTVITGAETTTWTLPGRHGRTQTQTDTAETYETQLREESSDRYDYTATLWVRKRPRLDEAQTQSAQPGNRLVTVFYPPSFVAKSNPTYVELSRNLGDGLDEALTFTALAHPISNDPKEFARVLDADVEKHYREFQLTERKEGSCAGVPGVVSTGVFHPAAGPTAYAMWSCDFVKGGTGYRYWYAVPQSLLTAHEPMLRRMVEGAELSRSTAAADEAFSQTYASPDGRVTVHYPPSFAASPQPDGTLMVLRGSSEAVAFRTYPGATRLSELSAEVRAEARKKAAVAKLLVSDEKEELGTCNGAEALIGSSTAINAAHTVYRNWHCVFLRDGVGYRFGYAVADSLAAERAPTLKKIVESASIK